MGRDDVWKAGICRVNRGVGPAVHVVGIVVCKLVWIGIAVTAGWVLIRCYASGTASLAVPAIRFNKANTILESDMIQECSRLALLGPHPSRSQACSSDHR